MPSQCTMSGEVDVYIVKFAGRLSAMAQQLSVATKAFKYVDHVTPYMTHGAGNMASSRTVQMWPATAPGAHTYAARVNFGAHFPESSSANNRFTTTQTVTVPAGDCR